MARVTCFRSIILCLLSSYSCCTTFSRRAVLKSGTFIAATTISKGAQATSAPSLNFPLFSINAVNGAPLVAVDLDFKGRVRTAAYFFESYADAQEALSDVKLSSPDVASDACITEVSFSDALDLIYSPPVKIKGLPGYFCYRLHLNQRIRADALRLTGLENLSDWAIPVFYSPENVESGFYLDLQDLVASQKTDIVGVSDLGRMAKTMDVLPAVFPPHMGQQAISGARCQRKFSTSQQVLAIEWNV